MCACASPPPFFFAISVVLLWYFCWFPNTFLTFYYKSLGVFFLLLSRYCLALALVARHGAEMKIGRGGTCVVPGF